MSYYIGNYRMIRNLNKGKERYCFMKSIHWTTINETINYYKYYGEREGKGGKEETRRKDKLKERRRRGRGAGDKR